MMISFTDEDEAHYLCALANSNLFGFAVTAYSINIQQDPHLFQNVRIPKYDETNTIHRKLAQLSRRAHEIVNQGELGELSKIEMTIDAEAARVWNLTDQELKEIEKSLGT